MPKYEIIRNRRLRVYERTPSSTSRVGYIWLFLNSAICIWLLTAVVGSVVTFTFSNLQSCLKTADEKAIKYSRLTREIIFRTQAIVHEGIYAKNAADLKSRWASIVTMPTEYSKTPLATLLADRAVIASNIRVNERVALMQFDYLESAGFTKNDSKYIAMAIGAANIDFADRELINLQIAMAKLGELVSAMMEEHYHWEVKPYCTVKNAFVSLWRADLPILEHKKQLGNELFEAAVFGHKPDKPSPDVPKK